MAPSDRDGLDDLGALDLSWASSAINFASCFEVSWSSGTA